MQQAQDFEGQTSGTTISTANSGTAPSTAYTAVVTGTAATMQYDNAHPAHGTNAGKFATAGTSTAVNCLQTFTAVATVFGRFYIYSTDWTSSQNFGARMRGLSTQAARICFDSTGHVNIHNTGNSTIATGSVGLSNATYYRVEFSCTPGTSTTGAMTVNVYLGDSVTLLDTCTTSSGNLGTNPIDEYGVGLFTATASVSAFWIDDTNVNDSAFPGPAVTTTPISDSDTGAFVDAGESITAAVAGAETGAGTDAGESLTVALSSADTGSAAEGQSVVIPPTLPGVPFLDEYVAGYNLYTGLGFGVDTTTAVNTWVLTDVTADVLQADGTQGIVIQRGRLDEFSQTSPAMAVFTLLNDKDHGNGDYSPRRPTGANFPYVVEGTPCQVAILTVSNTYEQFSGYVAEYAPDFDETGNYSVVVVTAYGSLQQIQQGQKPLRSALSRSIADTKPGAWWSMEEPFTATQLASGVTGGRAIGIGPGLTVGSTGAPGTIAAVDFSGGGTAVGVLPTSLSSSEIHIGFAFSPLSSSFNTWPAFYFTAGGITWNVQPQTGPDGLGVASAGVNVTAFSPTIGTVFTGFGNVYDSWASGTWHWIEIDLTVGGGNILLAGSIDGTTFGASAVAAGSLSRPTSVVLGAVSPYGAYLTNTSSAFEMGELVFWSTNPSTNLYPSLLGHAGEDPITRMARLFAENGIIFAADGTSTKAMGPQGVDTLPALVREAEAVDGGVLEDGVGFGCFMHTAGMRANQAATMTLALTDLVLPFKPVENNSKIVNDAIVSRPNGGSAEYIQPSGLPYSPSGVGGVGLVEQSYILNLQDDIQLTTRAGWYVHQGTVDEDRYSSMTINLARRTGKIPSWLACTLGSRATVTGNYSTGGVNGADVLLEGWNLTLSRLLMTVVANCSPAVAWFVAVVDDASLGRVTGFGTTLHAGISAGATSLVADAPSPWTTTALHPGDLPLDINLDGERVTVGAITGSSTPYTFSSLTRGGNGVSKSHSALAPIDIWRPGVVGL